jgi:outer membrane protein TolC
MKNFTLIQIVLGLALTVALNSLALAQDNSISSGSGNGAGRGQPAVNSSTAAAARAVQSQLSAQSIPQAPPKASTSKAKRAKYERRPGVGNVLVHQWTSVDHSLPAELQPNGGYLEQRDNNATSLTLKEAIYLAVRHNPGLKAEVLNPLAAEESVREANAEFDPLLSSRLDVAKEVSPSITNFSTVGAPAFSRKQYEWNFGVAKLSSLTNGTLFLGFDNDRLQSNARTWTVNPSYNPSITVSLTQPLLRNFGFDFATLNVSLAEHAQKESQYNLEQRLSDFVLQVASDYWNVVRAEQNLQVTRGALKLAQNLLDQDLASLKLGMVARIDVQEAQAETESWQAAVFAAQNTLTTALVTLRQEIMLNPKRAFLAEEIEPSQTPSGILDVFPNEEQSLEAAIEYRPELAAMREAIRTTQLQVRFNENQTLPQLNVGAQIGITSTAGSTNCFKFHDVGIQNCVVTGSTSPGTKVPFGGIYGDSLNRLGNFSFYNYAVGLNFEVPLSNDYANAALSQSRVEYDQQRLRYHEQVAQIVLEVETALSNVKTSAQRVHATNAASDYARAALSAEDARYRSGVADTHELLQYQTELITALGNQVQAQVDLEIAKLSLQHAAGDLLKDFQIKFVVEDPHRSPWYSRF